MTLRKRLDRLEAAQGRDASEPFVVFVHVMPAKAEVRVTGASAPTRPPFFAIFGAGPGGDGFNLSPSEGESEAAFRLRVEAEAARLHARPAIENRG